MAEETTNRHCGLELNACIVGRAPLKTEVRKIASLGRFALAIAQFEGALQRLFVQIVCFVQFTEVVMHDAEVSHQRTLHPAVSDHPRDPERPRVRLLCLREPTRAPERGAEANEGAAL